MSDVHDKNTRSYNMSRIRAKNTMPEMVVRKFLFANGIRYRVHDKNLPGKPDIVIRKLKTIIDVRGCFWHGHKYCKYFVVPKTKTEWWLSKINYNISNDTKTENALQEKGWNIINIWECELKPGKRDNTLSWLLQRLSVIQSEKM
jgi:DNA mismatch endonuclease, patch repair protein